MWMSLCLVCTALLPILTHTRASLALRVTVCETPLLAQAITMGKLDSTVSTITRFHNVSCCELTFIISFWGDHITISRVHGLLVSTCLGNAPSFRSMQKITWRMLQRTLISLPGVVGSLVFNLGEQIEIRLLVFVLPYSRFELLIRVVARFVWWS